MSSKEDILKKIRHNIKKDYDMPDIDIKGIQYKDKIAVFIESSKIAGCKVVELKNGDDLNHLIAGLYPEAKVIASNLPNITIANINPDTVEEAQDLNGTDVAILKGELGVAENACVWIPQTMKEKAVCFISEELVIIVSRKNIVNNMHEAYAQIKMTDYGYGCFISGPSKTADIEQALVMGAQAARGVTIVITD
jgi:L-lactate dehydrogenase complex protein LldG